MFYSDNTQVYVICTSLLPRRCLITTPAPAPAFRLLLAVFYRTLRAPRVCLCCCYFSSHLPSPVSHLHDLPHHAYSTICVSLAFLSPIRSPGDLVFPYVCVYHPPPCSSSPAHSGVEPSSIIRQCSLALAVSYSFSASLPLARCTLQVTTPCNPTSCLTIRIPSTHLESTHHPHPNSSRLLFQLKLKLKTAHSTSSSHLFAVRTPTHPPSLLYVSSCVS